MAEQQATEADIAEDGEAPKKKKLSGKVLVLFILLPLLLLGGGGGAAFFLMSGDADAKASNPAKSDGHGAAKDDGHGSDDDDSGNGGGHGGGHDDEEEDSGHGGGHGGGGGEPEVGKVNYAGSDLIFFELPDMIVNLNTSGAQPRFLRIRIALEFGDKKIIKKVRKVMPRIVDHFQVYLRELRREDLRGSAGMYRLKEELMIRVNQSVEPMQIRDVLFKEVLVQ